VSKHDQIDRTLPSSLNTTKDELSVSEMILTHLGDGIVLLDINGRIEWMNPACENMIGWSLKEVKGHNPQEFITPPEHRPLALQLENFQYHPESAIFNGFRVVEHIRKNGSRFWNQLSHSLISTGPSDHHKKIVVTCRDISDQIKTETALHQIKDDLEHAAYHDDLTGLANRKKLSLYLNTDLATRLIRKGHIGILQLDLDKFKEINDTLGHAAGDATLGHVASGLSANAGPGDLACRTGGDEFLLICQKVASKDALLARADLVSRTICQPLTWKGQTITVGISIGASMPGPGTDNGEVLIQHADQALYSAKNSGRGRITFYNDRLGQRYMAQQRLNRDLKAAIAKNQFTVFLQPILDLTTDSICGCEALIRWQHPDRGLLAPASFLAAADQSQLLAEIDHISMNLALDALVRLRQAGFASMNMSINVSSSILADANYPALLDWAIQSRDLPHSDICVEILETTILDGGDFDVVTAVERLRRIGVRISLDDFGTGYAGLAHMSALEIDGIKLDHLMINRLENDPRSRVIARSIIRLCDLLGMEVVAEGVETQGQLDILRRAKCPRVQGYGFVRPMSVSDILKWLHANTPLQSPVTFSDPESMPSQAFETNR